MYADDLVLWSTEEYVGTENYRLQQALKSHEVWMEKWQLVINAKKLLIPCLVFLLESRR